MSMDLQEKIEILQQIGNCVSENGAAENEENVLQNDNGYRTNGFGNLKYAMGNFKNDIFGDYIRYTHASCHSYVVMNIDGKILVVNGENDAETKEIYQRISEKVSKERK